MYQRRIAKAQVRFTPRIFLTHTSAHSVLDCHFDVRIQLGPNVCIDPLTTPQVQNPPYQPHGVTSRMPQDRTNTFYKLFEALFRRL
jgi:hypothetical protein